MFSENDFYAGRGPKRRCFDHEGEGLIATLFRFGQKHADWQSAMVKATAEFAERVPPKLRRKVEWVMLAPASMAPGLSAVGFVGFRVNTNGNTSG